MGKSRDGKHLGYTTGFCTPQEVWKTYADDCRRHNDQIELARKRNVALPASVSQKKDCSSFSAQNYGSCGTPDAMAARSDRGAGCFDKKTGGQFWAGKATGNYGHFHNLGDTVLYHRYFMCAKVTGTWDAYDSKHHKTW